MDLDHGLDDDDFPTPIDLGNGVYMRWLSWAPDRELNPQYADLADNDRTGIIVGHFHDDGERCEGTVLFDTPENARAKESGRPVWQVQALDPLTIAPSVLDPSCGLHGHITDGRWVPC